MSFGLDTIVYFDFGICYFTKLILKHKRIDCFEKKRMRQIVFIFILWAALAGKYIVDVES